MTCSRAPSTPPRNRAGHAVALLDGSKPLAGHADVLTEYRPAWIAGPAGTADALADCGLAVQHVTSTFGGELVAMADRDQADLHPDLAVMLATSGTTGSSKYVRLSAGQRRSQRALHRQLPRPHARRAAHDLATAPLLVRTFRAEQPLAGRSNRRSSPPRA